MANSKWQPDFIGIGAMKAASVWIFEALKEHPEICGSSSKEVHFFDRYYNFRKGIEYYKSFFRHCGREKIKGEFTPRYLYKEEVPERVYRYFPNTKIIVCFRNPIERAYSQYKYGAQQKGVLSTYKNFEEAIEKNQQLVRRGFYYEQLKRYFDFFPKKNIGIFIYEDLKNSPVKFIQDMYSFLGVDSSFIPSVAKTRANVSGTKIVKTKIPLLNRMLFMGRKKVKENGKIDYLAERSGAKEILKRIVDSNKKVVKEDERGVHPAFQTMPEETRRYLAQIYKKDIEKLEKLIERDLSFWK